MFGERYFATRERLAEVARGVKALAEETGADCGPLADPESFLAPLYEPFLFAVCGEVNAGKSAFLNGLFGAELCESNVLPWTKEVQWFRYGSRERREAAGEGVAHLFRADEFLRDFNVLDTPGSNGLREDCRRALEALLETIDLLFFVFPVGNPWAAATWSLISEHAPAMAGKVAIVIQQCDRSTEDELRVLTGHINELSRQKIGDSLPVFPVSGQKALQAKQHTPKRHHLWTQSGYPALEGFVSGKVAGSWPRREQLRRVRKETAAVLRTIEDRMETRRRTLDNDQGLLSDIESEVVQAREGQILRLAGKSADLAKVFVEELERMGELLAQRTCLRPSLRSLVRKDPTPGEIEKELSEAVQRAIEELALRESDELVAACRAHWETVVPRVEDRLEMPPPDFEVVSGGFADSRERFAKRLGAAARKAVLAQKIRALLDREMNAHRQALRRVVSSTLFLVMLAGLFGTFGLHIIALVLLLGAGGSLANGLWQARRNSRDLLAWFEEKSSACARPFAEALGEDYEEGVRGFFVEYATMFEGIRRHVADLKMKLKPQLDRWDRYFLEINAIEQDL
ncbi:GTPase [Roseibacillus ishigakijimensis]|uniref:50S ribosome-binding GTPase n=1 Tax=Roseibacillus ishigakijimensis TaxID=454146 RepID=A0A934RTL4_9BACT|nr:GTPase [Roseibacillus ishigakijimensis]MBK1833940.1 50S ribosome-binding GTPase [Roseibacillus ishigakijimensis]